MFGALYASFILWLSASVSSICSIELFAATMPGSESGLSIKSIGLSPEIRITKLPTPPSIIFFKVVPCKSCKHMSNEGNCIIKEVRKENNCDGECWPWRYGDSTNPEGRQCNICPFAHRISSYNMTLEELILKSKDDESLLVEWFGVLRFTVDMINTGKIKIGCRLKDGKKDVFCELFERVKHRTVTIQKSFKMVISQRNKGIPKEFWYKNNPGKTPEVEGHLVVPVFIQGRGHRLKF